MYMYVLTAALTREPVQRPNARHDSLFSNRAMLTAQGSFTLSWQDTLRYTPTHQTLYPHWVYTNTQ